MVAHRPQHYEHVLLRMALALVLVLAVAHPAQGSSSSSSSSSSWRLWRWRSLLSEAAADENYSSSRTTTIRLVAVLAPPVTASSSNAAIGSNLHASDQCGGAGGLCNQTTIGIPCGDHKWQTVHCPQNFTCTRRNASYWKCTLLPGRTAPRGSTFNSSERYTPLAQFLPAGSQSNSRQPGDASASSSSSSSSNAGGDRTKGSAMQHSEEPIVPICGPDMLRGHNRMCNRTNVNQYILPLDSVDPAAAGAAVTSAAGISRADTSNGLAAQMLRLGAVIFAAAVGAAVLGV